MVKTIVAILLSLLVLAGPASAQDPDPSSEDPAADEASGQDDAAGGSGDPADEASDDASDDAGESSDEAGEEQDPQPPQQNQQTVSCRALVTYIADPHMSPQRWVILDPDGCMRRTVERLIGPATATLLGFL